MVREVIQSVNFPERSVIVHYDDPPLVETNGYDTNNDCEMIFSSIDINGRGYPIDGIEKNTSYFSNKPHGIHPTGLLYGIGDSLAQIQLGHTTGNRDQNGYVYNFETLSYSLLQLNWFDKSEGFYTTSSNDDFATRLYQKRKGHEVLIINSPTQAKLFHRFYRKSNITQMKCSKGDIKKVINKSSTLNERFNFADDTGSERLIHREILDDIEIPYSKTPNTMGNALLSSVKVASGVASDYKRSKDKPNFQNNFYYNYKKLFYNFEQHIFMKGEVQGAQPVVVRMSGNGNILVNLDKTFLYNHKTGITFNETNFSDVSSGVQDRFGRFYKSYKNVGEDIYVNSSVPNFFRFVALPKSWGEWLTRTNTSDLPKIVDVSSLEGVFKEDALKYNASVRKYISEIGVSDEELEKRFISGVNYSNDELPNKYRDIDDIMWYLVVKDFAGVEFRLDNRDIKEEVAKSQLQWMKNVKSHFGVVWDTSVVNSFDKIESKYLDREIRSKFIYQDLSEASGWIASHVYNFYSKATSLGSGIVEIGKESYDWIKNNPRKSAALAAMGVAVIAETAYSGYLLNMGSEFMVYVTSNISKFVAEIMSNAGGVASKVGSRILDKLYLTEVLGVVKEAHVFIGNAANRALYDIGVQVYGFSPASTVEGNLFLNMSMKGEIQARTLATIGTSAISLGSQFIYDVAFAYLKYLIGWIPGIDIASIATTVAAYWQSIGLVFVTSITTGIVTNKLIKEGLPTIRGVKTKVRKIVNTAGAVILPTDTYQIKPRKVGTGLRK